MLLRPGTVLSGYAIDGLLGEGSMATVFSAKHSLHGGVAAIKVLDFPPGLDQTARTDLQHRFLNEAELLAGLHAHPNIVHIYDFGYAGPPEDARRIAYLVMEFVEGPSLREVLSDEETRLSPRDEIQIVTQIAAGLAHAHDAGIAHRDLKPANVMLSEGVDRDAGGWVKIVDFGIARLVDSATRRLTQPQYVIGTELYMSPERKGGEPEAVPGQYHLPVGDVHSLAVLASELVLKSEGLDNQLIEKLVADPKGFFNRHRWPRALRKVLERGLAKDPAARYQSAPDFARDFAEARQSNSQWWLLAAAMIVLVIGLGVARVLGVGQGALAANFDQRVAWIESTVEKSSATPEQLRGVVDSAAVWLLDPIMPDSLEPLLRYRKAEAHILLGETPDACQELGLVDSVWGARSRAANQDSPDAVNSALHLNETVCAG